MRALNVGCTCDGVSVSPMDLGRTFHTLCIHFLIFTDELQRPRTNQQKQEANLLSYSRHQHLTPFQTPTPSLIIWFRCQSQAQSKITSLYVIVFCVFFFLSEWDSEGKSCFIKVWNKTERMGILLNEKQL